MGSIERGKEVSAPDSLPYSFTHPELLFFAEELVYLWSEVEERVFAKDYLDNYTHSIPPMLDAYRHPRHPLLDKGQAIRLYLDQTRLDAAGFLTAAAAAFDRATGQLQVEWLGVSPSHPWRLWRLHADADDLADYMLNYRVDPEGRHYQGRFIDNRRTDSAASGVDVFKPVFTHLRDAVAFSHTYLYCYQVVQQYQSVTAPVAAAPARPLDPAPQPSSKVSGVKVWTRSRSELVDLFDQLVTTTHPKHGQHILTAPVDLREAWADYWTGVTSVAPSTPMQVCQRRGTRSVLGYLLYQLTHRHDFTTGRSAAPAVVPAFSCWPPEKTEGVRTHFMTGAATPPKGAYIVVDDGGFMLRWVVPVKGH